MKTIELSKQLNYTKEDFLQVTKQAVLDGFKKMKGNRPGVLLSGGVDSAILAILAHQFNPDTRYFTIGPNYNHPDVVSATRFAKEMNFKLDVYIPSQKTREEARKLFTSEYSDGDEAVLLILLKASKYATDVLCTDGIDELMGGYWEHWNYKIRKQPIGYAFNKFWDQLEPFHLKPLNSSGIKAGVNIITVFTDDKFIEYVSHIPYEDRVSCDTGKILWKDIARMIGVPEWVIQRKKLGFCDALKEF
jgi:asparagine synthetase B (glutamine-hydrolysing)